jgi:hypothetical protein
MRTRILLVFVAGGACFVGLAEQAQAWRGGGFSGFHAGGFGGGFGGFHAGGFGGFHAGGFGGGFGGFSSFHASGFGGGFGSVHHAGATHWGPETGFTHVSGTGGSGALGYGGHASVTHVGEGGAEHYGGSAGSTWGGEHYSSWHGSSEGAWGGYHASASYHPVNYGSIQHYGGAYGAAVYHGPAGGAAVAYHGPYSSGAAVKGPAGYGAAVYHGPAGGTAAAYRGPYGAGAVAHLPSGYTAAAWHGTTYYHSGYTFYHPTWYAGTVSYVPVYPPIGFFFGSLPGGATQTVVNNNTYYVSDGVYYQPSSQNGQQGYAVAEAPATGEVPVQLAPAGGGGPDPFELLKKVSDYMGREKHIKMTISETFDEVAAAGQKIQLWNERTIQLKRPDRISVSVSGAGVQRRITCNGATFTAVDLLKNVYATMPMKGSLDSDMDTLARQYGMAQPVEDLLYSDIDARLAPKIQSGQFLGREEVAGHTCSHLAFKQAEVSWQVWIDEGLKPVPWRLVIRYDSAPGRPQYTLLITKFETPIFMPDSDFKAKLPDGAVSASITSLTGQAATGQ